MERKEQRGIAALLPLLFIDGNAVIATLQTSTKNFELR